MKVEIVELRNFPSVEPPRIGASETHVFYRLDGGEVRSLNLHKSTADRAEIERLIAGQLAAQSALKGHTFEIK